MCESCVCVRKLCVGKLCVSERVLCVGKLCGTSCVCEEVVCGQVVLYVSKLCVDKL